MPSNNPLDDLDADKLTIADIKKLKDPALREALLDRLKRRGDVVASHQNHGSHADHSTSAERFSELEFAKKILRGGGGT
jgi:hypothetical protein